MIVFRSSEVCGGHVLDEAGIFKQPWQFVNLIKAQLEKNRYVASFFGELVDKQEITVYITWCAGPLSSGIATRFPTLAILPEAKPGIFEHLHHSSCGRPTYAEKESLELEQCAAILLRRVVIIPISNCTIFHWGVQPMQRKNMWHSLLDHWASYAIYESLEYDCCWCESWAWVPLGIFVVRLTSSIGVVIWCEL